jgi:hypothetical protein
MKFDKCLPVFQYMNYLASDVDEVSKDKTPEGLENSAGSRRHGESYGQSCGGGRATVSACAIVDNRWPWAAGACVVCHHGHPNAWASPSERAKPASGDPERHRRKHDIGINGGFSRSTLTLTTCQVDSRPETVLGCHERIGRDGPMNGSFRTIGSGSGPSPGSGRMPWFDPL